MQKNTTTNVTASLLSIDGVAVWGRDENGPMLISLTSLAAAQQLNVAAVAQQLMPMPKQVIVEQPEQPAPAPVVKSRKLSKDEMLAALKAAGVKQKGMHFMKEETLAKMMQEKGLSSTQPIGGTTDNNKPTPKRGGGNGGGGNSGPGQKGNFKKEIHCVANLKPVRVWKKDMSATMDVYKVKDINTANFVGILVWNEDKQQPEGLAAGYKQGSVWTVPAERIVK